VNQNGCSIRGTKKLWRSGHKGMNRCRRGGGADRASGLSSKRRSDCGNVRAFTDHGNSEPRGYDVSYQPFLGLTMIDPEQGGNRRGAIAGLAIAVAILALGLWLAHDLTAASKMQDCLMSGRTNCNVIPAQ
jgi:hypothetical protein